MSAFTVSRKILAFLVSATVLVGAVAAPNAASANPFFPHFGGHGFGGHGFGFGLAAGLALGVIAAESAPDCHVVHRVFVDPDGFEYVRPVRVCG